jgi:hypothetical protein
MFLKCNIQNVSVLWLFSEALFYLCSAKHQPIICRVVMFKCCTLRSSNSWLRDRHCCCCCCRLLSMPPHLRYPAPTFQRAPLRSHSSSSMAPMAVGEQQLPTQALEMAMAAFWGQGLAQTSCKTCRLQEQEVAVWHMEWRVLCLCMHICGWRF